MKTIRCLILLFFVYSNSAFPLENSKQCVNVNITQKNDIPNIDITFPNSENIGPYICLNNIIEETQVIKELQISFDSNLTRADFIKNKKYKDVRKIENLYFKVISWNEDIESSMGEETWRYYFVLLKHSHQVLLWAESETEIKSCKLQRIDTSLPDISMIEGKNSLVFTTDTQIQSSLTPIFPVTIKRIEDTNNISFHFFKSSNFTPNIFGLFITTGTKPIPFIQLSPSDIGPEQGVLINIVANNPATPSYNVFLAPGNTVTSYNKKRFELWGKSCIIELEKGAYNILGFIDTQGFSYKDKFNQWSIAFYSPFNGYLQLNGKINNLFNSFLYGDDINRGSRIKGLCQIENHDYFPFEIPSCIESRIPFPEQIILELSTSSKK